MSSVKRPKAEIERIAVAPGSRPVTPKSHRPTPALAPMIRERRSCPLRNGERLLELGHKRRRAVFRRIFPVDRRTQPVHVEQHVDRDNDHQDDAEENRYRTQAAPSIRLIAFDVAPLTLMLRTNSRPCLRILIRSRWCVLSHICNRPTSRSAPV